MGNLLMISFNRLANAISRPHHIVMLGLDNSGKTSLLYRAKLKELVKVHPTTAFNVESLDATKKLKYKIWDIGGRDTHRPLWKTYVRQSEALIFVVDSADSGRFEEARHELFNVLNSQSAQLNSQVPLLVVANKQDTAGALSPDLLANELNLNSLNDRHLWHVQATSIYVGDGFVEGLKTLGKMIAQSRRTNELLEIKTPMMTRRSPVNKPKNRTCKTSTGTYEGILV